MAKVKCPHCSHEFVPQKSKRKTAGTVAQSPPTLEEVAEYVRSRGDRISAEQFYDFYLANGWKQGSKSLKDWKAAVRYWERNDYGKSYRESLAVKESNAHKQPSLTGEQARYRLRRNHGLGVEANDLSDQQAVAKLWDMMKLETKGGE